MKPSSLVPKKADQIKPYDLLLLYAGREYLSSSDSSAKANALANFASETINLAFKVPGPEAIESTITDVLTKLREEYPKVPISEHTFLETVARNPFPHDPTTIALQSEYYI